MALPKPSKVALIKDADFYNFIKEYVQALAQRDSDIMQKLIHQCAQIHMEHITQGGDPFEKGSSRPLDFGHWAAHKLEHMTNFAMRHSEVVAVGIALDVTYAKIIGFIDEETCKNILDLLNTCGLQFKFRFKIKPILQHSCKDLKNLENI